MREQESNGKELVINKTTQRRKEKEKRVLVTCIIGSLVIGLMIAIPALTNG